MRKSPRIFIMFFSLWVSMTTPLLSEEAVPSLQVGHLLYGSIDASPKDIKVSLTLWMKELGEHIGIPLESHFYISVDLLEQDFTAGKLDYILIRPLDLIKYFDMNEHIAGFSPSRDDANANDTLVLLVRKDLNIRTLKDLKDRRLGIAKDDEIASMFIDVLLMEQGLAKHETFFSKVNIEKKRSKVLLDLFFGKNDAVVVTKGTLDLVDEMNPQVGMSMSILKEKRLQMSMASIFHKNTDPSIIARFESSVETLHENERAKQILMLFKADRLRRFSKDEAAELRVFYQRYLSYERGDVNKSR